MFNHTHTDEARHRFADAAGSVLRPIGRPREQQVFKNTVNALHLRVGCEGEQLVDLSQRSRTGFIHTFFILSPPDISGG